MANAFKILTSALIFLFGSSAMPSPPRSEEELRAAYTYQFISYITWPAGTGKETLIGVWEDSGILEQFEKVLAGRGTPDRPIRAIGLVGETVPEEVDLIFADKLQPAGFERLVKTIEGRPIIVVSPFEAHYRHGASVHFFSESGKLRFSLDRKFLENKTFKVSSQLLRLAKKVD
jgi:hypothetical protein